MSVADHVNAIARRFAKQASRAILSHRLQARHPTLRSDPTAIWDYPYGDIDAIELGEQVTVLPYAEIVVYRHSRYSAIEGRLYLGDHVVLGAGVNVRAAGGSIRIGNGSGIGQHGLLVAANHRTELGTPYLRQSWDESRVGIEIGENVWVGGGSIILPGVTIGDGAVIAAGSVVRTHVPANEIWGGTPARKLKDVATSPREHAGEYGMPSDLLLDAHQEPAFVARHGAE